MRLKVLIAVFLLINGISISFGQSDSLIVKTDSLSYILNYREAESFTTPVKLHIENSMGLRVHFENIIGKSKDSTYGIIPAIEILRKTGKAGKCETDVGSGDWLGNYLDQKDFILHAGVESICFPSPGIYQVRIALNWKIFGTYNYYKSYSNWFTLKVVPK